MALYRYLKQQQHSDDKLPDPQGPLSIEISSTAIVSANEEVRRVVSKESVKQRGPYAKFTAEQRAAIGKRAAEHGVAATVRYYRKQYANFKESSVRTWKKTYTLEMEKRRRQGHEDVSVKKLPEKKRGRPFILGEELEMQVRAYLNAL